MPKHWEGNSGCRYLTQISADPYALGVPNNAEFWRKHYLPVTTLLEARAKLLDAFAQPIWSCVIWNFERDGASPNQETLRDIACLNNSSL